MKIFVGLTLLLVASTLAGKKAPIVNTNSGRIRGFWGVTTKGREFQAYEGIPYAQPPVGELRFQPPQPIEEWVGELQATRPGSKCLQFAHVYDDPNDRVSGSDDCLFLNVYTPAKPTPPSRRNRNLLPVIFYIHSGAFQFGQGATRQPHYLLNKDVVFVSINYRLGALGFLSTEDAVVPGNMGLKDQNLALRWVTENIEAFGGDPKQITLTGLSAGAASVHYHYLSPLSRGLFQRGISLSGTALDSWTQTEGSLEKAKKLGALLECTTSCNEQLVRCLRTRPAERIFQVEGEFMGWLYNAFTPFGPVVEKNSDAPFIDKSPIEIISSGESADLPWITSVVSEEGLYPAAEFIANEELMKELDENWESIAPHLLDYNYTIPHSEHASVAREIRKHYLGNEPIDRQSATALIHMVGDRLYAADGQKAAKAQAKASKSSIRFSYFSYRGEFSLTEKFTKTKRDFGVSHADDDSYLFYEAHGHLTREDDLKISDFMVQMWTSYAITGVPDIGIEWPSVDPSSRALDYLHIKGPEQYTIERDINFGESKFWSTIDFNENKLSSQTSQEPESKVWSVHC